jgi:hypothetical protein
MCLKAEFTKEREVIREGGARTWGAGAEQGRIARPSVAAGQGEGRGGGLARAGAEGGSQRRGGGKIGRC